ncbi:MAG: ABC transporter substrate-binding protein [Oceanibaculum sp.]
MRFVPKAATTVLSAVLGLGFVAVSTLPGFAADPGIYADRIVLGQTAALDGTVGQLGTEMRAGLLAAFKEANDAGGVNGRKIELVSLDDSYRATTALANTEQLLFTEGVYAMIGAVGTAPSEAAAQLSQDMGIPFIGAFTGSDALRQTDYTNVVNIRASYDQETEAWVERLTADLGVKRFAVLYQDDSYGISGLNGVRKALEKRGLKPVAEGSYFRNTTAVKTALLTIRRAEPEAVLIVGAFRPAAEFIKLARSLGVEPHFVNMSFTGGEMLAQALAAQRAGVIVTQVVPSPLDSSLPLVQAYQAALTALDEKARPGAVSLEGYIAGRLFVAVVGSLDGEPTQRGFIEALYRIGRFDLGGYALSFEQGKNQGADAVYVTVIQGDGTLKQVERLPGAGG